MVWLNVAIAVVLAVLSFFGAGFLSSAWKRRNKAEGDARRIDALLPGFDCGLCGSPDCRSYAEALDAEGADPALCLPGGSRVEARLREALAERGEGASLRPLRAVVRCAGRRGVAAEDFLYDGRASCASAARLYGGPKRCKDGCIGLGSCVAACPLGAIRVAAGVAVVNPGLCTGCGACLRACPPGVIDLVPRELPWYVACSSRREPESRARDCSASCTACGECESRSVRGEFRIRDGMARESAEAESTGWADIAEACPTGAILRFGLGRRKASPIPKS